MTDLRAGLRALIEKSVVTEIAFGDGDNVFELGLVDSMFALDIVELVEATLGRRLPNADLNIDNFSSIDATVDFYERKRSESGGA